ncbi:MAG: uroporphyrinogen synthase [Gammaproteobacteria bacterium]|nr:uroporphyrinogen synthase [Gammaproteobacteria bacterium]
MPLCRLLESSGAVVVRLPVMDIKPVEDAVEWRQRLGPVEAFDFIIFTSANAVRFGAALVDRQRPPTLAAIGPATARALNRAGFTATIAPTDGFDSESLLLHPLLAHVRNRRVLIVKGRHGREVLREQLARRGARVIVAEVYTRERVHHGSAELDALALKFAAGEIQVITATSVEIAAALLAVATPALRRELDRVHWLVPGARVAEAVRELGVTAPMLQANSATDHDLAAAISRWRATASGA